MLHYHEMPIGSHSKTTIRPPVEKPLAAFPQVPAHHRDSAAGAARMKSETEAGWEFSVTVFFFESWHWWSFGDSWICWVFKFWVVLCPMLFERLSMFVLSLLFLCFEASMLCSEFLPGQHHAPQKSLDSHGKWPFVMFDKFKKKLHKKKTC